MSNQANHPAVSSNIFDLALQALGAALPVVESAHLDDVDRKRDLAANVCFEAQEQVREAIAQLEGITADSGQGVHLDTIRLDWVIRQISGSGIGFISGLHYPSRDQKETRAMIDSVIDLEKTAKADCLERL